MIVSIGVIVAGDRKVLYKVMWKVAKKKLGTTNPLLFFPLYSSPLFPPFNLIHRFLLRIVLLLLLYSFPIVIDLYSLFVVLRVRDRFLVLILISIAVCISALSPIAVSSFAPVC